MVNTYGVVPLELKQRRQWVNWRYVVRDGKKTKVPFQPDGKTASSTDRTQWSDFKAVVDAESKFDGIGYVFDAEDCYVGIDLDGCRNPETGELDLWAKNVIVQLGSYAEVSPSLTGVKIFASSSVRWSHKKKVELGLPSFVDKTPAIEVYDGGRYFCVTGKRLAGMVDLLPVDKHFDWLADRFKMREAVAVVSGEGIKHETPVIERASAYLSKMEPSVAGQSGHAKCFHAACVLVMGFGLSEDEALNLLSREFNPRCQPAWSEKELRHKVKSANQQPGARCYLRDAEPESWSKVRLPSNYKEHVTIAEPELNIDTTRKTTLHKAAKLYLSELASGRDTLIDTGIPELDYAIGGGVSLGEMVIVAGRPSHGKSAVALQMAHTMSQNGLPAVIISEEMSALALGKRAIQYASGTPEEHWRTSIDDVAKEIDSHFDSRKDILVIEGCGSVDKACQEIEKAVNESGVKVAMVDYAQILTSKGKDTYERTSRVSSQLRMLASRLQIVIIVLAQLNREIEKRKSFIPVMSDIKETGQLEQDADVIIFGVWPHRIDARNEANKYLFFVCKNRNRAINKSAIECVFNPARQKLLEATPVYSSNYDSSFDNF